MPGFQRQHRSANGQGAGTGQQPSAQRFGQLRGNQAAQASMTTQQAEAPQAEIPQILSAEKVASAIAWNQARGAAPAEQLTAIQSALGVPQTGAYDAATVQALAAFQRDNFLDIDGKLGNQGLTQLGYAVPALRAVDTAAVDPATWDAEALAGKVARNESMELRIDWVRNLQTAFGLTPDAQGRFTAQTVSALGRFQREHRLAVDGVMDAETRAALETNHDVLKGHLLGENLAPRVIIAATASEQTRYAAYKQMIQAAGGAFSEDNGEVNLLGIRGVLLRGEDGALELYQTDSAQNYAELMEKGGPNGKKTDASHHFMADRRIRDVVLDDVIVSMWVDRGEDNKITGYHVSERQGTVDPGSHNRSRGTGHLRDGQYVYGVGTHGTQSTVHQNDAREVARGSDDINYSSSNRYTALRAQRDVELWRDADLDGFLSQGEQGNSVDLNRSRAASHVNHESIAMNIHLGGNDSAYSQGCQNIRKDDYAGFMSEMTGASNSSELYYTLIDASKIAATTSTATTET
ncbi:MAG: peptidoglycan hydrolase-like protein with peptidoglycan-binding domain [Myxococcota bacterium]|jgi:peptidoglycan hydrolase-like protein with peptidoglycan-binding domain